MNTSATPLASLRVKFWVLAIVTIAYILITRQLINPLTGGAIVRFELAKTIEKAAAILQDWDANGMIGLFKRSVYLDFGFILLYSAVFFYGCRFLSRLSGHYILEKAGYGFSWLAPLAGICDVMENIGMLRTVHSAIPSTWVVKFTYHISVAKFSMLIIVILFMFICFIMWLIGRFVR